MITTDELFAEAFEPVWMKRAREDAEHLNLCKVRRHPRWIRGRKPKAKKIIDDPVEIKWRQEAYAAVSRINQHHPRKPYAMH